MDIPFIVYRLKYKIFFLKMTFKAVQNNGYN